MQFLSPFAQQNPIFSLNPEKAPKQRLNSSAIIETYSKLIRKAGHIALTLRDLWKSDKRGRKGKRRFYSRSIAFTIEQIKWLKEESPVNASQLLRWLVEGAMTAGTFLELVKKCKDIIGLEKRIAYLELRLSRGEKINHEIYENLKKKRMKIIASIVQPTSD